MHTWELKHMEIHRQASSPTTSVKWHPCSSIWQTHTCRFPMWRISLSVWVVNVEKQSTPHWYAEACAQTGSVLLLGCAERRSGTALRMSAKLSNTHTHTRPSHRYVPGPVGNLCLAKELSETLSSPISLTGVEKAWAADEELGVAHRCTFRRMGFPLYSRLQAFFISQLRIFHCSGNNNFFLMRENWCERASSVWV